MVTSANMGLVDIIDTMYNFLLFDCDLIAKKVGKYK